MKEQPITDNRPLMNDAELTQLEAEFIERYKGSEQHPIRTLLNSTRGSITCWCCPPSATSLRKVPNG